MYCRGVNELSRRIGGLFLPGKVSLGLVGAPLKTAVASYTPTSPRGYKEKEAVMKPNNTSPQNSRKAALLGIRSVILAAAAILMLAMPAAAGDYEEGETPPAFRGSLYRN